MDTIRWADFGGFAVGDERFRVNYDFQGFSLIHDLGRGSSHSVGHLGKYPTLAEAEAAALEHAARSAAGRSCYDPQ